MIKCEKLIKIYKTIDSEVVALQGLDLEVKEGEFIGVIGNSGSGKSTLLNILGGLERPSAGTMLVDGKDLLKISDAELIKYKRDVVGFVWQNSARNLIPYLTALENIEIPMYLKGKNNKNRALELLDMVGMSHRKNSKPSELSGGEQQRIAIAIALSSKPKLLLADEPTGAVDTQNANSILQLFNDLNKNLNQTIVIVTHDRGLASKVGRVVVIKDGITASEFIKVSYTQQLGNLNETLASNGDIQQEFIVVDKSGKMQIPSEYLRHMNLNGVGKILVEFHEEGILLKKNSLFRGEVYENN